MTNFKEIDNELMTFSKNNNRLSDIIDKIESIDSSFSEVVLIVNKLKSYIDDCFEKHLKLINSNVENYIKETSAYQESILKYNESILNSTNQFSDSCKKSISIFCDEINSSNTIFENSLQQIAEFTNDFTENIQKLINDNKLVLDNILQITDKNFILLNQLIIQTTNDIKDNNSLIMNNILESSSKLSEEVSQKINNFDELNNENFDKLSIFIADSNVKQEKLIEEYKVVVSNSTEKLITNENNFILNISTKIKDFFDEKINLLVNEITLFKQSSHKEYEQLDIKIFSLQSKITDLIQDSNENYLSINDKINVLNTTIYKSSVNIQNEINKTLNHGFSIVEQRLHKIEHYKKYFIVSIVLLIIILLLLIYIIFERYINI